MKSLKFNKLIFTLMFVAVSSAQAGGVRGGGEIVDINSHPHLRDLVDKTVCRWEPASKFLATLTDLNGILAALADVHWYLASAIPHEGDNLKVCLTKNLWPVETEDWDSVSIAYFVNGKKQLAVRLNDMIFIDEDLLKLLPTPDQAMLAIHEISHSFIPMFTHRRNEKLRSFVSMIYQNSIKRVSSEDLALNMQMNDIAVVRTTQGLDNVRASVETMLNKQAQAGSRLKAYARVSTQTIVKEIWAGDQEAIGEFTRPYYYGALEALTKFDTATLKSYLEKGVSPTQGYFPNGDSLLDAGARQGKPEIIKLLLSYSDGNGNTDTAAPVSSAGNQTLYDVIRGKVKAPDLDKIISLGVDPNRFVVWEKDEKTPGTLVSLYAAAVIYNRIDIAVKLSVLPQMNSDTLTEGEYYLIHNGSSDANQLVEDLVTSQHMSVDRRLFNGATPLEEAARCQNNTLVKFYLSQGAFVDMSAFDVAVAANNNEAASAIASDPRFHFEYVPVSDVAQNHDKAVATLKEFVVLNQPQIVKSMLAIHKYGWFDLYPLAELAKYNKETEIEKLLRSAMGTKPTGKGVGK